MKHPWDGAQHTCFCTHGLCMCLMCAQPLVLERMPSEAESRPNGPVSWVHTKALYRLTEDSMRILKGCTAVRLVC